MDSDEEMTSGSSASRLLHPVAIGIVTAVSAPLALWLLLVAGFSDPVMLGIAVIGIPMVYTVLICAITRAMIGRARVGWNIALTTALIAFGTAFGTAPGAPPAFGSEPVLPLTLGLAAALASLAAHSGPVRIVGIIALGAQLTIAVIPLAADRAELESQSRSERSAADDTELARRNEVLTRPYVVPGLVVQSVQAGDYESTVLLARDPAADAREHFHGETIEITLRTAPLVDGESVQSEACRWILDPERGGSVINSCEQLDAGTWLLTVGGERSVVRLREGSRIEISDERAEGVADLLTMLDRAVLMSPDQFAEWNAWLYELDQRV